MAVLQIPTGGRLARLATIIGAGAFLYLIVTVKMGFVLADRLPKAAPLFAPGNAVALSAAADHLFATATLDKDGPAIIALSRRTIDRSPLSPVAVRNLGFVAAAQNDEPHALALMNVAGALTLRDYLTHAWLLNYHYRTGDIGATIKEADIALRQDTNTWPIVMPTLVDLASEREVVEPLARALARSPDWRGPFLVLLGQSKNDPHLTYALYRWLEKLGAPASIDELAPFFSNNDLASTQAEQYQRWIQLLPKRLRAAGAQILRDGDFHGLAAPPPFSWRYYSANGTVAEPSISLNGRQGNALYVSYSGEAQTVFAEQQLILSPGRYRLRGRIFVDQPVERDQFFLTIRCRTASGESEIGHFVADARNGALLPFTGDFIVPTDCPAPRISVTGSAADNPRTVHAWIDDLRLDRGA